VSDIIHVTERALKVTRARVVKLNDPGVKDIGPSTQFACGARLPRSQPLGFDDHFMDEDAARLVDDKPTRLRPTCPHCLVLLDAALERPVPIEAVAEVSP